MKRYYSQTTGCSYLLGLHTSMPEDAVEIPEELFLSVICSPLPGKVRSHDEQGLPYLVDVPETPQDLPSIIASERYSREASGMQVGDYLIETNRDSQALIASAGLAAVMDPNYRCNFKTLGGFVDIDASQIISIAKAVRAHVQACFDREAALLAAVENGSFTLEMLEEGWPG